MKSPRIYLYKVTFEEIPDFYWGIHKEKSFEDGYLGSPITHAWKWDFYTPRLQVCEVFDYSDEGWATAQKVERRVILNDLNNPFCLNEHCGGSFSLEVSRRSAKKVHEKKDADGKSLHGKKNGETTFLRGVGIYAPGVSSDAGKIGGKVTASQVWESTIDGYRGAAGRVACHNKHRGWDPDARIRIS
jgi:hypothetical protein